MVNIHMRKWQFLSLQLVVSFNFPLESSLRSPFPTLVRLFTMPRRNRSSGGSRPVASRSPLRNPPKPAAPAPPPATIQQSNGSSFGAALVDGLAIGTGSALGQRVVDAVMGPRVIHNETIASNSSAPNVTPAHNTNTTLGSDSCGGQSKAFQECLNSYGSDIGKCQFYMDMLQECRRGTTAAPLST